MGSANQIDLLLASAEPSVRPAADSSSFMETLTPMRGLAAYARHSGDVKARAAVERAACVLLDRQLFKRRSTSATIRGEFVQLHYPLYWHYDILGGLKVLGEAGMMGDSRCASALELLAGKRLADGGRARRPHRRGIEVCEPLSTTWAIPTSLQ